MGRFFFIFSIYIWNIYFIYVFFSKILGIHLNTHESCGLTPEPTTYTYSIYSAKSFRFLGTPIIHPPLVDLVLVIRSYTLGTLTLSPKSCSTHCLCIFKKIISKQSSVLLRLRIIEFAYLSPTGVRTTLSSSRVGLGGILVGPRR